MKIEEIVSATTENEMKKPTQRIWETIVSFYIIDYFFYKYLCLIRSLHFNINIPFPFT